VPLAWRRASRKKPWPSAPGLTARTYLASNAASSTFQFSLSRKSPRSSASDSALSSTASRATRGYIPYAQSKADATGSDYELTVPNGR
jgi:hypothetical protein